MKSVSSTSGSHGFESFMTFFSDVEDTIVINRVPCRENASQTEISIYYNYSHTVLHIS